MRYTVVAYEGDIPELAKADGKVVGTLDVSGNGYAGADDVRERALEEAAAVGGTHLLIAGEGSSTSWAQITPDRATTQVYGNTATTTYTPGTQLPITRHRGAFVVVRVPPSRWIELPVALRPAPGYHFKGRYLRKQQSSRASQEPHAPPAGRQAPENWSCVPSSANRPGMCFRTSQACEDAYETLEQNEPVPCEPAEEATCFSSLVADDPIALSCHPSMQDCRAQRDLYFGQGHEIVRECTQSQ